MEAQGVAELVASLDGYREQLQQVNELLVAEPANEEYKEMANELKEVIELTEELLVTARQNESADALQAPDAHIAPASSLPRVNFVASQNSAPSSDPESESAHRQNPNDESHALGRIPVGTKVQAIWSGDGQWYAGVIDAITSLGYHITYTDWGNSEEVAAENVRPIIEEERQEDEPEVPLQEDTLASAELEAEAAKQAIKRKLKEAASADMPALPREVPNKLKIKPDDPDDVKALKRKKIHSFRSKQRLEVKELAQNQRQYAWQQFQTQGKQKKVGFFTGRKKDSIFKSPEDIKGKVGVTGSGHGMTDFQRREKYVPAKGDEGDE